MNLISTRVQLVWSSHLWLLLLGSRTKDLLFTTFILKFATVFITSPSLTFMNKPKQKPNFFSVKIKDTEGKKGIL